MCPLIIHDRTAVMPTTVDHDTLVIWLHRTARPLETYGAKGNVGLASCHATVVPSETLKGQGGHELKQDTTLRAMISMLFATRRRAYRRNVRELKKHGLNGYKGALRL
jgi:hypothetical protein